MPSGSSPGERRGGRAKGTPNRRSLVIAEEAKARVQIALHQQVSPVEVLLEQMWWYRNNAQALTDEIAKLSVDITDPDSLKEFLKILREMMQFRERAQSCAADAAPYCHSRLASIIMANGFIEPNDNIPRITDKMSPKDAAAAYEARLREQAR